MRKADCQSGIFPLTLSPTYAVPCLTYYLNVFHTRADTDGLFRSVLFLTLD